MISREILLPKEKKVAILTTKDNWMEYATDAFLEGETCILPVGCGAYILAGGISVHKKESREVARLINTQKGRSPDRAVAYDMPPEEMPFWVDERYQERVGRVANKLMGRPFGIIAPVNEKVPEWHSKFDHLHKVHEKLFVWADMDNIGPLADLYRYIREQRKLSPADLTLIATSGNMSGLPNNNSFNKAYEQLGNSDGIAYAVMDPNEGGDYSDKPVTIVTALPWTRGREKLFVIRSGSMKRTELQSLLPEATQKSTLGLMFYRFQVKLEESIKSNILKR